MTLRRSFLFGLMVGIALTMAARWVPSHVGSHESYRFVNSNPLCLQSGALFGTRLLVLDEKLKGFISNASAGSPDVFHAYVRDLGSGEWFGNGEDELFRPGSLMKLPLAIGYAKWSEENPTVLESLVRPTAKDIEFQDVQGYAPSQKVVVAQPYTIRELIRRALVYSDNGAALALESFDNHRSIMKVALEMNVPVREGVPPVRPITIREYARFFLSLYNSTYLNVEHSEWLLSVLSEAEFKDGLRGGVPDEIRIAHKFGESLDPKTNLHYLSDCGIVYLPGRPYVACLSGEGKDPATLARGLQSISGQVYKLFEQAAKADAT